MQRDRWNRCTLGLKSMSPTATHATLTTGSPAAAHSVRISARPRASRSSGSAKTSIESNPMTFVWRMP